MTPPIPKLGLSDPESYRSLAHRLLLLSRENQGEGACVKEKRLERDRRKWTRLPLAIPVFVRSRDEKGKEILEFATALNVSAGGALVAVRRSLPLSTQVLLEIPSAPLAVANSLPKAAR